MNLREVQLEQADYDKDFWSHQPGIDTIRHSTLHLGKLLGKISAYCEVVEHGETPLSDQLDDEVIPDLLIFAARLANDRGLDLTQSFEDRTKFLRKHLSQ